MRLLTYQYRVLSKRLDDGRSSGKAATGDLALAIAEIVMTTIPRAATGVVARSSSAVTLVAKRPPRTVPAHERSPSNAIVLVRRSRQSDRVTCSQGADAAVGSPGVAMPRRPDAARRLQEVVSIASSASAQPRSEPVEGIR